MNCRFFLFRGSCYVWDPKWMLYYLNAWCSGTLLLALSWELQLVLTISLFFFCLAQSCPHTVQCTQKKNPQACYTRSQNKFNCLTYNSSVIINWHVLLSFLEIKLFPAVLAVTQGLLDNEIIFKAKAFMKWMPFWKKVWQLASEFWLWLYCNQNLSSIYNCLNDIWPQIDGYRSPC